MVMSVLAGVSAYDCSLCAARTCMILELCGETEVEGHVGGQDAADDQLADLLQGHTNNRCGEKQHSPT